MLETEATGDAEDLAPTFTDAEDALGVTVCIVDTDEWEQGDAKGICEFRNLHDL